MHAKPNQYHHACIAVRDTGVMNANYILPWKQGSKRSKGDALYALSKHTKQMTAFSEEHVTTVDKEIITAEACVQRSCDLYNRCLHT